MSRPGRRAPARRWRCNILVPAARERAMSGLQRAKVGLSATWTFFEDDWHAGDVRIMGPRTHACWLGSMVFDGARAFEGVTPDLDLHCTRVNRSAESFLLKALVSVEEWI